MKKVLALLPLIILAIAACNSYGEKVKINDVSEVYYKGDGVNADDAKRLGDFLLKNNYFDTKTSKTVQLMKTSDTFDVKFVVDKTKVEQEKNAEFLFQIMGTAISADVFHNKPVKIILADQYMKGFKEVPMYSTPAPADSTHPADTTQAH